MLYDVVLGIPKSVWSFGLDEASLTTCAKHAEFAWTAGDVKEVKVVVVMAKVWCRGAHVCPPC